MDLRIMIRWLWTVLALLPAFAFAQSAPTIPPATVPCNPSASQYQSPFESPCATTGTGNVVEATSPSLTTPALDVPSFIDLTNAINVPGNQITGTVANANLQGTAVTYNTATTYAFGSGDNGAFLNQHSTSSCATTLPQIGTSGITANAWQGAMENFGAATCSVTPQGSPSPSTINSGTVLDLGQYGWAIMLADGTSPGNYNALVGGGYTFNSAGTATWPNSLKTQSLAVNGIQNATSGQGWIDQHFGQQHQLVFGTDTNVAAYFNGLQDFNIAESIASTIQPGNSYPAVSWSGSGCTGQPTDSSTAALSATFTQGSASISATNTFSAGQAVTLVNAYPSQIPAPYTNGQIYYVIATGLSGSAFELSLTSGGSSVGVVTGSTTSGITVAVAGNHLHIGGVQTGGFTVPSTGTYVSACLITLTFAQAATWGYKCHADDETANANMTQTGHTANSCTIAKATAVSAGDYISVISEKY